MAVYLFVHPPTRPTGEQRIEVACPICPALRVVEVEEPVYTWTTALTSSSIGLALAGLVYSKKVYKSQKNKNR